MEINLTPQDVMDMVERQIQKSMTDKLTSLIPGAIEKMLVGLEAQPKYGKTDNLAVTIIRNAVDKEIGRQLSIWMDINGPTIRQEIEKQLTPQLITSQIASRITQQLTKKKIELRPFDSLLDQTELDEEE